MTYDSIIKEIWGPNMKNDNRDPSGQHGQYPPEDRKKSCGAPVYFHGGGRGLPDRGAGLRGGQGIDGTEGIAHFLPAGQKLVKDGGVGGGGTVEKDNGLLGGYGPGAF